MTTIYDILLVLHFVGWAIVLGGWIASLRSKELSSGVFHGAATAFVAGGLAWIITLPGWVTIDGAAIELDPAKMAIKLTTTALVTLLAWLGTRPGPGDAKTPVWAAPIMGALTLINIVIAVFWH